MDLIDRNRYVDKVLAYMGKGLIIVLTGQRRVGKSYIMQCVARRIYQGIECIHIRDFLKQ